MTGHEIIREAIAASALHAADAGRSPSHVEILDHLAMCDECVTLLRDSRETASELALLADPVLPSEELEGRILAEIRRESEPVAPRRRTPLARVLAVAASVALVASLGWSASLISRVNHATDRADALRSAVTLATDPTARAVRLSGKTGDLVLLYTPDGDATLIGSDLPAPPRNSVFELWVIKEGRPSPVLTFAPVGRAVVINVPITVRDFSTVAVTVERRLERAPTSDPVYVGEV